ncbi:hypothetical protein CR513_43638, partial [Mucuna pruriens]
MIEDGPIGQLGQVTNYEFPPSNNTILMREDPNHPDKLVEDEGAEAEALVEMERWIEQERPKFQPLVEDLEGINLENDIETREV